MSNFIIEKSLAYDKPIDYRGLLIYPVTVKDYLDFHLYTNCLLIEKNRIPDIKIIKMSYLDYLFYLRQSNTDEGIAYFNMFHELLKLCFKLDGDKIKYGKDENGKALFSLDGIVCDKNDFLKIREIICKQNMIELPNENIDPKLKKALDEAEKFKNKNSKKMCSFEDQMVCVFLAANIDFESIKNLTIRKFSKIIQRADHKLHYEIYKGAEMSGMVEFKQGIDHWMSEIKSDKYSDLLIDYEGFRNKNKI